MNTTVQGPLEQRQETVTQESLLLSAAERIGRIRQGRIALHLHLSQLRPQNREEGHVRIAVRMLEQSLDNYRGQIFVLGNSDIVLLCKDARIADLDAIIFKLRGLFSKDPLTYSDGGDGQDRFASWYELDFEYDTFLALCQKMLSEVATRRHDKSKEVQISPLDAKTLSILLERLRGADIGSVLRRQAAVGINERNYAELIFQEFYVSMSDLQKAIAPDINLLANRWLFQHFSQAIDLKVLAIVSDLSNMANWPHTYSLNVNLATAGTGAFRQFAESMAGRANIILEVQAIDIFADINGFFVTRDALRAHGHRLLLDGVNAMTLQFMDIAQFGADLIKIAWSPEFADAEYRDSLREALTPVGFDRVVLSRCDSESSIKWGLAQGIQQFQGRYIDSMLTAVTMAGCDKAVELNCTLQQCTNRKGVITAGGIRKECGNHPMLDSFPRIAAPRR
jgi:hypothetical protein